MDTTSPYMGHPPDCQKENQYPSIEMLSVGKSTALNQEEATFCIFKRCLNSHAPCILLHLIHGMLSDQKSKTTLLCIPVPSRSSPVYKTDALSTVKPFHTTPFLLCIDDYSPCSQSRYPWRNVRRNTSSFLIRSTECHFILWQILIKCKHLSPRSASNVQSALVR